MLGFGGWGRTPVQLYQVRLYAWVSEGMEGLLICFTIIIFTPPCYYSHGGSGSRRQGAGSPENYFLRVSQ